MILPCVDTDSRGSGMHTVYFVDYYIVYNVNKMNTYK